MPFHKLVSGLRGRDVMWHIDAIGLRQIRCGQCLNIGLDEFGAITCVPGCRSKT